MSICFLFQNNHDLQQNGETIEQWRLKLPLIAKGYHSFI